MQGLDYVRSAYRRIVSAIEGFIRVYSRPHAARENTELFPKLRGLISEHEYEAMAELFKKSQS